MSVSPGDHRLWRSSGPGLCVFLMLSVAVAVFTFCSTVFVIATPNYTIIPEVDDVQLVDTTGFTRHGWNG